MRTHVAGIVHNARARAQHTFAHVHVHARGFALVFVTSDVCAARFVVRVGLSAVNGMAQGQQRRRRRRQLKLFASLTASASSAAVVARVLLALRASCIIRGARTGWVLYLSQLV